ncbi:MAG: aldo/keto reductase [Verrucomicrobiota bacterium]
MANDTMTMLCARDGEFPALGFGTWQLNGETARKSVTEALDAGYRHVDTARMYKNEADVGRGIADSNVARDDIFLTTKIFMDALDAASVKRELESSLQELATDYVDLVLIHWPTDEVGLDETLGAMHELRQAGKTRHVGVSNFPIRWLEAALNASSGPITCNQVEYHPFLSQSKLLEYCRSKAVPVVAYSPLARGSVQENPLLQEIGREHGKNAAQVALRWLLQQNGVGAVPKSSNPEHIRANLDVFDFELSEDEMRQIHGLDRGERRINPDWAPDWD